MPRLIDADKIKLPQGFFEKVDNVPKFYEWLDEQPTVDAEPVRHGYNTHKNTPSLFKCSLCGWFDSDTYTGDTHIYNYCPYCGAKMDEVTEDAETD